MQSYVWSFCYQDLNVKEEAFNGYIGALAVRSETEGNHNGSFCLMILIDGITYYMCIPSFSLACPTCRVLNLIYNASTLSMRLAISNFCRNAKHESHIPRSELIRSRLRTRVGIPQEQNMIEISILQGTIIFVASCDNALAMPNAEGGYLCTLLT